MLFDFTANVCDDAIKACIRAVGTKRLLFGSDLPIAIMRMYRVVEGGVYRNVVPRGLYGDVSGDPHMRQTDETDITLMIYEELARAQAVRLRPQAVGRRYRGYPVPERAGSAGRGRVHGRGGGSAGHPVRLFP